MLGRKGLGRGKFGPAGAAGFGNRRSTAAAKLGVRAIYMAARSTNLVDRRTATLAKAVAIGVFELALWAIQSNRVLSLLIDRATVHQKCLAV